LAPEKDEHEVDGDKRKFTLLLIEKEEEDV
jgi:hypothetical protein